MNIIFNHGTTGEVALELNRKFIGCDIGERAFEITKKRLENYKIKTEIVWQTFNNYINIHQT